MKVALFNLLTLFAAWVFVMAGGYALAACIYMGAGYELPGITLVVYAWPAVALALAVLMCRDLFTK